MLLSNEQQKALKDIQALDSFDVHVLQGVTGSGKTEVYLQAIEKMLRNDKSVLVLVPEISLVPQHSNVLEIDLGMFVMPIIQQ